MQQRLTRKETQQQTRDRLLDAAARVFSRQGYYAVSVEEVAAEAGFSKGAVYSNFESKEELFLALIDRRFDLDVENFPGFDSFIQAANPPKEGKGFAEIVESDRTWSMLLIEFSLYAMRNEAVRQKFASRLSNLHARMEKSLTELYAARGKSPTLPVNELPWTIIALGMGTTMQYFIHPEGLPEGTYERALEQVLK